MIKRLKNYEIDKTRWDIIVSQSDTPHVYLLSWFLDIVAPDWECLIYDNYKAIFPLPVKRKLGIPYLVQPLFCQKLAILGTVNQEIIESFYKKICLSFPYIHIHLQQKSETGNFNLTVRTNYTLYLTPSYNFLKQSYSGNNQRNIKKAQKQNLKVKNCTVAEFISFYKLWHKGLASHELGILQKLLAEAEKKNLTATFKVDADDETIAAACLMEWNERLLNMISASSVKGRKKSAMYLLLDSVIQKFSLTGHTLDFEGSMIPGVADFFKGFGSKTEEYYKMKKVLFF